MEYYVIERVHQGQVSWATENLRGHWGLTTDFGRSWKFTDKDKAQQVAHELGEGVRVRLHIPNSIGDRLAHLLNK